MANVFHEVPQPMNEGSGLPGPVMHCQVLERFGRHSQSGQRMRLKSSSSSGRRSVSVRSPNTGPLFRRKSAGPACFIPTCPTRLRSRVLAKRATAGKPAYETARADIVPPCLHK